MELKQCIILFKFSAESTYSFTLFGDIFCIISSHRQNRTFIFNAFPKELIQTFALKSYASFMAGNVLVQILTVQKSFFKFKKIGGTNGDIWRYVIFFLSICTDEGEESDPVYLFFWLNYSRKHFLSESMNWYWPWNTFKLHEFIQVLILNLKVIIRAEGSIFMWKEIVLWVFARGMIIQSERECNRDGRLHRLHDLGGTPV